MNYAVLLMALTGLLFASGPSPAMGNGSAELAMTEVSWQRFGGFPRGCDGQINSVHRMENGDLIVGGSFRVCGNSVVNNIAKWSGGSWHALGDYPNVGVRGLVAGAVTSVKAIASSGQNLYIAGSFTSAGGVPTVSVAHWNGTAWGAVGTSATFPNNYANDILINGPDIYVAGRFGQFAGVQANRVVRFNGEIWESLGVGASNGLDGEALSLAWFEGDLIVGGRFQNAGGVPANRIAAWNGTQWNSLGTGVSGPVDPRIDSLFVVGGVVYAAGEFKTAGDLVLPDGTGLAIWDGGQWLDALRNLTGRYDSHFTRVLDIEGVVYGCGFFNFPDAGPKQIQLVQLGLGNEWEPKGGSDPFGYGSGVIFPLYDCTESGSNIIGVGVINTVSGESANGIARFDSENWERFDAVAGAAGINVVDGSVNVALRHNGELYAGGTFASAGSTNTGSIARFSGGEWFPLGFGISSFSPNTVRAILADGDGIIVGGQFAGVNDWTQLGSGIDASGLARWSSDGGWEAIANGDLTSGVNGRVNALSRCHERVYAAGSFTRISSVLSDNIAVYDGNEWSSVGGGLNGEVLALACVDDFLVVGGIFTLAGGEPASRVALWTGQEWLALEGPSGEGVNNSVSSLAVWEGNIYVGGGFSAAGGAPASRIARWDGVSWHPLGQGFATPPVAIAGFEGELVVAGSFATAGGIPASNLAAWNGSEWRELAGGAGSSPRGLKAESDSLLVFGGFVAVGGSGIASSGIASLIRARIFKTGFEE